MRGVAERRKLDLEVVAFRNSDELAGGARAGDLPIEQPPSSSS